MFDITESMATCAANRYAFDEIKEDSYTDKLCNIFNDFSTHILAGVFIRVSYGLSKLILFDGIVNLK